jgi:hypothetical protein
MELSVFLNSGYLRTLLTVLFLLAPIQTASAELDLDIVCEDICTSPIYASSYSIDFQDCLYSCENVVFRLQNGQPGEMFEDTSEVPIGGYPIKRQKSSFVRIGRPKSTFVRVGRSVDAVESENEDKRATSSFVRIGKSDPELTDEEIEKRAASSFVRIGKNRINRYLFKRPSSFVRIGKKSYEPDDKRMSNFVRIGKSDQSYMPDEDNLIDEEKRMSSFVRIGKNTEQPLSDKRLSSFVRIGRTPDDAEKRAASSFVRIGRQVPKRLSSFVRIGKSAFPSDKRLSSFVRIGRGYPGVFDSDKRLSSFVRIGKKSDGSVEDFDERASQYLDENMLEPDNEKRMSNFVRIGKRNSEDKGSEVESKA